MINAARFHTIAFLCKCPNPQKDNVVMILRYTKSLFCSSTLPSSLFPLKICNTTWLCQRYTRSFVSISKQQTMIARATHKLVASIFLKDNVIINTFYISMKRHYYYTVICICCYPLSTMGSYIFTNSFFLSLNAGLFSGSIVSLHSRTI